MVSKIKSFCNYLSRKVSLEQSKSLETKLDRCLSTYQLIFYGISQMVGAGIYVLTGHMIRARVGPASNVSFMLSGIISIFTGLCYSEFATMIPKAGSCYTYTYLVMGELPAFVIGWTMIMDYIISLASISKGFSGAMNLLSYNRIKNFTDTYVALTKDSEVWESSVDLIAALLLIVLFLISLSGANISLNINSFLASLQICFLCVVIISCFIYGNQKNYTADGGYLPFGPASIFQGAGIAIFAYSGFECLANSAEETKDPNKSIPIALFTSLGMVMVLYVLASSGLSYLVPRLQIDEKAPFIAGFSDVGAQELKWISGIGTLFATGASKLTSIYVIPRQIYAMAHDGLLFRFLGIVNKKSRVPIPALVVGLIFSIVLAMFVKIQVLADITSMGIVLSFTVVGIDLIIFRYLYQDEAEEGKDFNTMAMRINTHHYLTRRRTFQIIFFFLLLAMIFFILCILYLYQVSQIAAFVCLSISGCIILAFIGILSLYKPSYTHKGFVSPLMPFTPIIAIFLNMCLLLSLPGDTWLRFIVWISIGLVIYFAYGIRNSNLSNTDDESKELLKLDEKHSNDNINAN